MMNHQLDNLLGRLQNVQRDHTRAMESLAIFPEYASVPVPQVTWTLLGLLHCHSRMLWARTVVGEPVRELLRDRIWKMGLQDHDVPGLPGWKYRENGYDFFLVNRKTGEEIPNDLHCPDALNPYALFRYLRSMRSLGPAQERLDELFPRGHGLTVAVGHLDACHAFEYVDELESSDRQLVSGVRGCAEDVEHFLTEWRTPERRLPLAIAIGDWPFVRRVAEAQGLSELASLAAIRAETCGRQWLNLTRVAWDADPAPDQLHAFAACGEPDLQEYLKVAFGSQDMWLMIAAMEVARDDPAWCPDVLKIFKAMSHGCPSHGTGIVTPSTVKEAAARYLAKHGHPMRELMRGLTQKNPDFGSTVRLAIDYAPRCLTRLLPLALRSRHSSDRLMAAALLAAVDCPWSRRELTCCLNECQDRRQSKEVRHALLCGDEKARATVDAWNEKHPEEARRSKRAKQWVDEEELTCQTALKVKTLEFKDRVSKIRHHLNRKPPVSRPARRRPSKVAKPRRAS